MKQQGPRQVSDLDHLDRLFAGCRSDPWGIDWRGSQKLRRAIITETALRWAGRLGRPSSMLDIGCSTGDLTSNLSIALSCDKVVGLDISPHAIEVARRRFGNGSPIQFIAGNYLSSDNEWTRQFDLVVCSLIFPYLDEEGIRAYLGKIRDTALGDRGGSFLMVVEDVLPGTAEGMDPAELDHLLQLSGFKVLETVPLHGRIANLERDLGLLSMITHIDQVRQWRRGKRHLGLLACALARPILSSTRFYGFLYRLAKLMYGPRGVDRVIKVCQPS